MLFINAFIPLILFGTIFVGANGAGGASSSNQNWSNHSAHQQYLQQQNEAVGICLVCAEMLNHDNVAWLPCAHHFHDICIRDNLDRQNSCPNCERSVTADQINKIVSDTSSAAHGQLEDDDLVCPICLESLKSNSKLSWLPCAHHFHFDCIDKWLSVSRKPACPLCNKVTKKTKIKTMHIDITPHSAADVGAVMLPANTHVTSSSSNQPPMNYGSGSSGGMMWSQPQSSSSNSDLWGSSWSQYNSNSDWWGSSQPPQPWTMHGPNQLYQQFYPAGINSGNNVWTYQNPNPTHYMPGPQQNSRIPNYFFTNLIGLPEPYSKVIDGPPQSNAQPEPVDQFVGTDYKLYQFREGSNYEICIQPAPGYFIRVTRQRINLTLHFAPNGKSISEAEYALQYDRRNQFESFNVAPTSNSASVGEIIQHQNIAQNSSNPDFFVLNGFDSFSDMDNNFYPFSLKQLEQHWNQDRMQKKINEYINIPSASLGELEQILYRTNSRNQIWKNFWNPDRHFTLHNRAIIFTDALNNALYNSKGNTDNFDLTEVLLTMTNEERENILSQDLCEKIRKKCKDRSKEILYSLCNNTRDSSFIIDLSAADQDARKLVRYFENKEGKDKHLLVNVIRILTLKNYSQLRAVFRAFQEKNDNISFVSHIQRLNGDGKSHFLHVVKAIARDVELGRPNYLATLLKQKMVILSDRSSSIFAKQKQKIDDAHNDIKRILLSRAGIDLEQIVKIQYEEMLPILNSALHSARDGVEEQEINAYREIVQWAKNSDTQPPLIEV